MIKHDAVVGVIRVDLRHSCASVDISSLDVAVPTPNHGSLQIPCVRSCAHQSAVVWTLRDYGSLSIRASGDFDGSRVQISELPVCSERRSFAMIIERSQRSVRSQIKLPPIRRAHGKAPARVHCHLARRNRFIIHSREGGARRIDIVQYGARTGGAQNLVARDCLCSHGRCRKGVRRMNATASANAGSCHVPRSRWGIASSFLGVWRIGRGPVCASHAVRAAHGLVRVGCPGAGCARRIGRSGTRGMWSVNCGTARRSRGL